MLSTFPPLQYLLIVFAGWVHRQQLDIIDYLQEENRVLRELLGDKRLRFTDAQRRRLAEKARRLGRKVLNDIASIVTPYTLMAWHRRPIAMKWDHSDKRRPGRPRTMSDIGALIVRMAGENRSWGYTRNQGTLANLGHRAARGTVANILKAHGIDPAPRRGKRSSWEKFLKAHWEVLAATDFFTVEVWTLQGLVTHYVLFFIELATRSVHIAGITTNPNELFLLQVGRNLTDVVDGILFDTR